jgi:hypothetical protein
MELALTARVEDMSDGTSAIAIPSAVLPWNLAARRKLPVPTAPLAPR